MGTEPQSDTSSAKLCQACNGALCAPQPGASPELAACVKAIVTLIVRGSSFEYELMLTFPSQPFERKLKGSGRSAISTPY